MGIYFVSDQLQDQIQTDPVGLAGSSSNDARQMSAPTDINGAKGSPEVSEAANRLVNVMRNLIPHLISAAHMQPTVRGKEPPFYASSARSRSRRATQ